VLAAVPDGNNTKKAKTLAAPIAGFTPATDGSFVFDIAFIDLILRLPSAIIWAMRTVMD
jgi:hypothetical protein